MSDCDFQRNETLKYQYTTFKMEIVFHCSTCKSSPISKNNIDQKRTEIQNRSNLHESSKWHNENFEENSYAQFL